MQMSMWGFCVHLSTAAWLKSRDEKWRKRQSRKYWSRLENCLRLVNWFFAAVFLLCLTSDASALVNERLSMSLHTRCVFLCKETIVCFKVKFTFTAMNSFAKGNKWAAKRSKAENLGWRRRRRRSFEICSCTKVHKIVDGGSAVFLWSIRSCRSKKSTAKSTFFAAAGCEIPLHFTVFSSCINNLRKAEPFRCDFQVISGKLNEPASEWVNGTEQN